MPKGFTEREKDLIRQRLIERGRELYEQFGVRKTNVDDLVRAVGISKGAFYLFYPSKEELFLQIIEAYEDEFRSGLLEMPFDPDKTAHENFKALLKQAFTIWRTNPIFSKFSREDYQALLIKLPEERVRQHLASDTVFVAQLFSRLQEQGIYIRTDIETFAMAMTALFFVTLHEDDFGPDSYPRMIDTMIDMAAQYFVPA